MRLIWKKLHQEKQLVRYRKLIHKHFLMPDGREVEFTTTHDLIDGVATIALTEANKVVIARQFRPGPERIFDELPGGTVDPGEKPEQAALRELEEETGYTTNAPLIYLGRNYRDAYSNEVDLYYIAVNCRKKGPQKLEEDEYIKTVEIAINELIENAKTARMTDVPAVFLAYDKLMELSNESK